MNLNQYANVRYLERGRDIAVGVDCWGFFRHRALIDYAWPPEFLPLFGRVSPSNGAEMNSAELNARELLITTPAPAPGVMACVFDQGGNFRHVGIVDEVDGVLSVSHIGSVRGVEINRIRVFEDANRMSQCRVEYRTYRTDPRFS